MESGVLIKTKQYILFPTKNNVTLIVIEKYHSQMKEAQQVVAEKTSSLEAEAYKTKRLQVCMI